MFSVPLERLLKTITTTVVYASALLVISFAEVQAGKPPSCTISQPQNDPVSVTTGGSVVFQGVVSSGTPPYDVTWTFGGGTPSSASDPGLGDGQLTAAHNIVYNTPGTFTTTMAAIDSASRRPRTCETSYTVNVAGDNNPPVAQNDEYNTQQDTPMLVIAPGVLGNDNDPDGDPLSAQLVSTVSNGNLNLELDGSFVYSPDAGFYRSG